jgi:hypothetical protein
MNGRRIIPAFTTEERAFRSLGSAGFTVQTYPSHLAREREVAAILDRLPEKGRVPPSSPAGMAP